MFAVNKRKTCILSLGWNFNSIQLQYLSISETCRKYCFQECIIYLLLHNKLPSKLIDFFKKNYYLRFYVSRTQEIFSWILLTLSPSWCCSQDVSLGCNNLKVWLALEDQHPRWPPLMAVDRKPQIFVSEASPWTVWCALRPPCCLLSESITQERKAEVPVPFTKLHAITLTYASH